MATTHAPTALLTPSAENGLSGSRHPRISVLRNPEVGFGLPILGWLLRRRGWQVRLDEAWNFTAWDGQQRAWRTFTIPPGFLFDMASIPALLWGPPFNYSPFGTYLAASLEHDFLCVVGLAHRRGGDAWLRGAMGAAYPEVPLSSKCTHEHFARRLLEDGTRKAQAAAMGKAVKTFGPRWKTATQALALLLGLMLPGCAQTIFYGSDGRRLVVFQADMETVTFTRDAKGAVTWSAARVDHSAPTRAQGEAAMGRIRAVGVAAASAGMLPAVP